MRILLLSFVLLLVSCKGEVKNSANEIAKESNKKEKNIVEKKEKEFECNPKEDKLSKYILSRGKGYETTFLDEEELKEFYYFYRNASDYKETALHLLKCPKITSLQKYAVIDAMNGLSFDDYLEFVRRGYKDYKKGNISEDLLSAMIGNNFALLQEDGLVREHIIMNYNNEKVVNFLEKILKNETISNELIEYIKEILSGELWEDRKKHYLKLEEQNKVPIDKSNW